MIQLQFVTAVHGNEYMPTLALASLGLEQVVANPRALARGVRHTEQDLNASFGKTGNSYEEKRARNMLTKLDKKKLVIDFHTFTCHSEPFAIIVDLLMLPLASSLGVKHVVYMKYNVKEGHALINHRQGVSVEVGRDDDSESFMTTRRIVRRLNKNIGPGNVRVYEVFGRINEKGEYSNFVHQDGFVPVLYGDRPYGGEEFYGLKAKEITGTI